MWVLIKEPLFIKSPFSEKEKKKKFMINLKSKTTIAVNPLDQNLY